MLKELIEKNRSYRRFFQEVSISFDFLKEWVDLARLSPSARNAQPLKYYLSCDRKKNNCIFPHLSWAGYLKDWDGPPEGEKPSAYIIILLDKTISENNYCDHGIAAQSILLGAVEKGFGGCIIAAVKREELRKSIGIPENLDILYVLALGKPKEKVALEKLGSNGDIKYWRDKDSVHHVPKRCIDDIILK